MASKRIFVYGTLQFPAIAAAVTGRRLEGRAATLDGYARFQVRDAPYPGITPRAGARVAGLVYDDVDAAALARIDDFEGEMYRREAVTVVLADGSGELMAETYVMRPRWRSALGGADWDADAFARDWHDVYVRACSHERATGSAR